MDPNSPYYLNLLINLALLAIGAASGYFTAKRNRQQDVLALKNELIGDLSKKVKQLEEKVKALEDENEKLHSTIDDLIAVEEARKRVAQRSHRPSPPAVKNANVKAESEDTK